MTLTNDGEPNRGRIRLWPGVLIVVLQWLVRFGLPAVVPDATIYGMLGAAVGALLILIWWAFFSRVPHPERWSAFGVVALALVATRPVLDPSIATGGMGVMFWIMVIPGVTLAFVVAAAAMQWAPGPRRIALVAAIVAACGFWTLLRTDGITGGGTSQLAWRWSKTAEQ